MGKWFPRRVLKPVPILLYLVCVVSLLVVGNDLASTLGKRYARFSQYKVQGFPNVHSPSHWLDLKQALGLQDFYSQLGQDKWVTGIVFPGVRNGFFVDIGAWHAETDSNSKALEELGWEDVCIEPFPVDWEGRICQLFEEVVYSRSGEFVTFQTAGELGGIDEHIDTWRTTVEGYSTVELVTTTIADILDRAEAPAYIHYVSLDTEGSDFEILSAFPFQDYRVWAFSIEHNYEEPKRQQIRELLEEQGYEWVRNQLVDDWYVAGP